MKKLFPVLIEAEAKDEADDDVRTDLPDEEELSAYLRDLLRDQTKHNGQIGWRVTDVVS